MTTLWLTLYILIWPSISAVVLFVIVRGFFRDMRKARQAGRDMV
ncbi:putative transporter small subunit [Pseudaminobacter salicylatoxidans]|nr:putative transporter small subunit [Pseudaminobacter salicylatoxidans]